MSIRILTARPHRLFPFVVRHLGDHLRKQQTAVLLVPEQFTLAAERELMDRLQLPGMFDLEVLSPSRLYEHILADAGKDGREPLSDAGRRMAIRQALERLADQLPYYGSIIQRQGFVEKLSALITDLKRGGLTPDALKDYANELDAGIQKEKLKDLATIYAQYDAILKGRFSDSEDQLAYVAGRLGQSSYLKGKHLYVYGFDTLPEQLMRMLAAAAHLCESLTICLICDASSAPDGELFAPIRQGIARFSAMLAQDGLSCEVRAFPPQPLSHAPGIAHLDQTLFVPSPSRFAQKPDSIFLASALSPFEEATLMTRQVMRLLQEGIDPERIAVLYPADSGYEFAVTAALNDSGIPFYTDIQLPALSHGLVRFLMGALRAMAEGWKNRSMMAMLKSGYAPFTFDEICELENYVRSYGIDRKRWTVPFTRGDAALRERCEVLRERLMAPLIKARQALVDARDAVASVAAVFQLLVDIDAYEALKREEERLLQNGFNARANQNSQIWQAVLTLLDQLVRLSGASRIPLKHIASRLECGFAAVQLASLPPSGGMLHAGALGHLLAEEADAVFLLGLNDGLLVRSTDSLLTPEERAQTQQDTGCFLGLTDDNRALLAKLDLKRAMTLPSRWLFLSFARTATEGTALRPLSLLSTIQHSLFPDLSASPVPMQNLPVSATQALGQLGSLIRAHAEGDDILPPLWENRLQQLMRSPDTQPDVMRLMRSLRHDGTAQALLPSQARALFGEEVLTVSRLEQFAECPFKHFITYGLRPHIHKEWKVDPIRTGTFYHDSLNNFSHLVRREKSFPHLSGKRIDEIADAAIAPLLPDLLEGPMGDGERSRAKFELACRAVHRAAHTMTRHLAAGQFTLYKTEATFGYEGGMPPIVLVLPDGREIAVRGRIDRIDRYDAPDAVYLRVIDYKSSQQALDAARTWWGLQLQLLLYLDVCTSALPGAKPAGAFYFYVADPLVEVESDLSSLIEKKFRDLFHLRGIALSDVEIVSAMDSGETPCVLPPLYVKSGELRKTAKALSMDEMTALLRHARDVATSLAQRLFDGETAIHPARDRGRTSCDVCEYRAVCHFDPALPEANFCDVPDMNMDQLRSALHPRQTHPKEEQQEFKF